MTTIQNTIKTKNQIGFIWKIKTCVLYCLAFFILFYYTFCSFVLRWLPYEKFYNILVGWSHKSIWLAKIICNIKYEVIGKENIPNHPVIIMSNHQSMWDTIIMQVIMPTQTWILKKELLSIPLFGWLLQSLKPIAIDRKKSSSIKQLITQGTQKLKEGKCIIIYPEGTRVPLGETKPFSRSGAALAIAADNTAILPIAHNAGVCWPKGLWIKQPGIIKIVIGKEISTKGKNATEITTEVENWINNKRKEL